MDKKSLSERDICTKFITPALRQAGWDEIAQIREEVGFTKGRIIVRGRLVARGKAKRADYVLYYKPNIPIAVIEAKDNTFAVGQPNCPWSKTAQQRHALHDTHHGTTFALASMARTMPSSSDECREDVEARLVRGEADSQGIP